MGSMHLVRFPSFETAASQPPQDEDGRVKAPRYFSKPNT